MPDASGMSINTAEFVYPNLPFDDEEYTDTISTPQPLSHRSILLVNCNAAERGLSAKSTDAAEAEGSIFRIYVGPMTRAQRTAGRFNSAAEAMGIPENERAARSNKIRTLIYFQPVSIILLHHIQRTPRLASTEMVEIHVDASFNLYIERAYFSLLAVYSPFAPATLRKIKIHTARETQVVDMPNGPWFPPSSITTEVEISADDCAMALPHYNGTCLSWLAIADPKTPTMLRFSYNDHLNAFLMTLHNNVKWLIHLEISLAFSDSLFIIMDACANLKHLTSLTITECDPSFDQSFNPDDDFKYTFSRKLQPLIGLRKLSVPEKLRSGYLTHWYPHLEVEFVPDWETQAQSFRAFLQSRELSLSVSHQ